MQYTSAFVWALGGVSVKALAFTLPCVFVFLSDSKQNGDANVALSEEEGCSLTQPLSPSEKWSLRCSRGRDKTKKEATCFLLTSGDPNVHTGKLHTYPYIPQYTNSLFAGLYIVLLALLVLVGFCYQSRFGINLLISISARKAY